jgi:hypothetical protein
MHHEDKVDIGWTNKNMFWNGNKNIKLIWIETEDRKREKNVIQLKK